MKFVCFFATNDMNGTEQDQKTPPFYVIRVVQYM